MADRALPHLTLTTEARHRPDVLRRRQPYVLPWHLLFSEGGRMARVEVLCLYRHVAHEQHLARRALLHAICGTLSELLAVGRARQRLPRLPPGARHVAKADRQAADAVLHPSDGKAGTGVHPVHPRHRPRRLRL